MAHINEEYFYDWVFDGNAPSATEQQHLAECAVCQKQLAAIQSLAGALQVAGASEPSAAAWTRYSQLYTEVQQAPSLIQRLADFVVAQLQWDGRHQPTWQGVRNTQVASYRLIYATPQAEIELLVAPRKGRFHIEGEVVPVAEPATLLPARCELQTGAEPEIIEATTCQPDGRFHLENIAGGQYRLAFFPPQGPTIVIDKLELA